MQPYRTSEKHCLIYFFYFCCLLAVEGELHPAVEETLIKLLVGSLLLINCSGDCVGSSQGNFVGFSR